MPIPIELPSAVKEISLPTKMSEPFLNNACVGHEVVRHRDETNNGITTDTERSVNGTSAIQAYTMPRPFIGTLPSSNKPLSRRLSPLTFCYQTNSIVNEILLASYQN